MKQKVWKKLLTGVLLTALLSTGCGASADSTASSTTESAAMDMAPMEESAEESVSDGGGISSGNGIEAVADTERKLIKTVNLDVQTLEFDAATEELAAKVNELGGYVESSSVYGSDYYYESTRSASYTVRIPADRLRYL